jgi:hypothetical protein
MEKIAALAAAVARFPHLKQNATIQFNQESFLISREILDLISLGFTQRHPLPYRIQSNVSRLSVLSFLKPFQSSDPGLTSENASDLLTLALEFESACYCSAIDTFLREHGRAGEIRLIPLLIRLTAQNQESADAEAELREIFLEVIDDDRLLDLPVAVLDRVMVIPPAEDRANFGKVFRFCIRVLNRVGSLGSVLFRKLDTRGLSREDWVLLKSQKDFLWSFLNDSVCDSVLSALSSNEETRRQTRDLLAKVRGVHEAAIQKLEHRLKSLEARSEQFTKATQVQSLEARLVLHFRTLERSREAGYLPIPGLGPAIPR